MQKGMLKEDMKKITFLTSKNIPKLRGVLNVTDSFTLFTKFREKESYISN